MLLLEKTSTVWSNEYAARASGAPRCAAYLYVSTSFYLMEKESQPYVAGLNHNGTYLAIAYAFRLKSFVSAEL